MRTGTAYHDMSPEKLLKILGLLRNTDIPMTAIAKRMEISLPHVSGINKKHKIRKLRERRDG